MDFYKTLIVGASGSGKTYAMRNLNKDTTAIINVEYKPLPFKGKFKRMDTLTFKDAYLAIKKASDNPDIKTIVIDSLSAYLESLNREATASKKGYDVWSMYNAGISDLLTLIKTVQKEVIVTAHYEILNLEGSFEKRVKANGKQWEGVIEKEFTIVMYADKKYNDKTKKFDYYFSLAGEGLSAKCPPDIFGEDILQIENDYQFIIDKIEEFKK